MQSEYSKPTYIGVTMGLVVTTHKEKETAMTLEQYWTRQEVIKISDMTPGAFRVFERLGIVTPLKIPTGRNGLVLFNWEQLLIAKTYSKLREQASLQSVREALNYLTDCDHGQVLRTKKLIVYRKAIYWVSNDEEATQIIKVSGKNRGQFVMMFAVESLLNEMIETGKKCEIVDFEERIKLATQRVSAA